MRQDSKLDAPRVVTCAKCKSKVSVEARWVINPKSNPIYLCNPCAMAIQPNLRCLNCEGTGQVWKKDRYVICPECQS